MAIVHVVLSLPYYFVLQQFPYIMVTVLLKFVYFDFFFHLATRLQPTDSHTTCIMVLLGAVILPHGAMPFDGNADSKSAACRDRHAKMSQTLRGKLEQVLSLL